LAGRVALEEGGISVAGTLRCPVKVFARMEFVALSTPVLIAIGLIVFGAATVKGVAGLGFPLITVPLVANIVGPHAAVVIIAVPTVASNLFMVAHGEGR